MMMLMKITKARKLFQTQKTSLVNTRTTPWHPNHQLESKMQQVMLGWRLLAGDELGVARVPGAENLTARHVPRVET